MVLRFKSVACDFLAWSGHALTSDRPVKTPELQRRCVLGELLAMVWLIQTCGNLPHLIRFGTRKRSHDFSNALDVSELVLRHYFLLQAKFS